METIGAEDLRALILRDNMEEPILPVPEVISAHIEAQRALGIVNSEGQPVIDPHLNRQLLNASIVLSRADEALEIPTENGPVRMRAPLGIVSLGREAFVGAMNQTPTEV